MENDTTIITACISSSLAAIHVISRLSSALVGLSANILLFVVLVNDPLKCFRNPSSFLVLNLCVSDILVCIGQAVVLFWRTTCINGVNVYIFFHLPVYVSFSSIVTMAFDRFVSSVYPLKYKIVITRKFTFRLILAQWLFYVCSVLLEFFYAKWLTYPRLLTAIIIIFGAVIMYGKASNEIRKKSKELKRLSGYSSSTKQFHQVRVANEKRFLTTLLMVSIITVLTLCPLVVYEMISGTRYYRNERLSPSDRDNNHMWLVSLFLVNFWINPFIYAWRLTRYRKTYSIILKKIVCIRNV